MTPSPVSVVIPAYNRESSIVAAIESVLAQSWRDFELVVVDDGSEDGTLEAARSVADPRLRVVAAPRNGGAATARNLGAAEARGDWIAFQDSDDEWLPRKLERQMARLLAPAAAHVGAYCGLLTLGWLDEKPGERLRLRYRPKPEIAAVDGDILAQLLIGNLISTQTLVVRRDRFAALGGFDPETTPIEDWDFVIRLAGDGPIAFVDEPLVMQRFSPNSITRDRDRALASTERVLAKNAAAYARHPKAYAEQCYRIGGGHRQSGDLAAARAWLARARRADPAAAKAWAMSLGLVGLGAAGRLGLRLRGG
jgi:glycosyltransferase involved in cell wall biosynthesis